MVLAHSLRDNGTKKRLAALVTLDSLSSGTIEELKVKYSVSVSLFGAHRSVEAVRRNNPRRPHL